MSLLNTVQGCPRALLQCKPFTTWDWSVEARHRKWLKQHPTPHSQHQQTHPGINSSFRALILASGNWGSSCVACLGRPGGYLFHALSGIFWVWSQQTSQEMSVQKSERVQDQWQLSLQSCEAVSTVMHLVLDICYPCVLEYGVTDFNNSCSEPTVQLLKQKCPHHRYFTC